MGEGTLVRAVLPLNGVGGAWLIGAWSTRPRTATCARRAPADVVRAANVGGRVKVKREIGGRQGKTVTTVYDVPLDDAGLKELAGRLKKRCGVGGSVKDGVIELQGDHRDVVIASCATMATTPSPPAAEPAQRRTEGGRIDRVRAPGADGWFRPTWLHPYGPSVRFPRCAVDSDRRPVRSGHLTLPRRHTVPYQASLTESPSTSTWSNRHPPLSPANVHDASRVP